MSYCKTGLSHTRIDNIYKSMIDRCHNLKSHNYHKYGAKGIRVCDEWRLNKKSFFDWAFENGYEEKLTLDRIDTCGNYQPDNCRWASYKTQNNNRTSNHWLEIDGKTHTISEWSDISGIKARTILERVRKGWTHKDAVFKPIIDPHISGAMARKKGDSNDRKSLKAD